MKLLLQETGIAKAPSVDETLVFRSDKLMVWAEKPSWEVGLGGESRLLIWGDLYYLTGASGQMRMLDGLGAGLLQELFGRCSLDEAIPRLEGRYIGVLIKDESVTVFADHYNQKEVFYSEIPTGVVASTELPFVLEHVGKIDYDQNSLTTLLTVYGYFAPKRHTIYSKVRRLGVGERLSIDRNRFKLESIPFVPKPAGNYGSRELEEYSQLFQESVLARSSRSDNCVLLSSGWDSTAVLGTLVHHHGASRVRAVTGRMDYSTRRDSINIFEIERAQKIADYYSVPLDIVSIDLCGDRVLDLWESIRGPMRERHLYNLASVNHFMLAEQTGSSKTAGPVFTGEHSDGLHNFGFAQYATIFHADLAFREYSDKMGSYLFGPTFLKAVDAGTHSNDEIYRFFRMLVSDGVFADSDEDSRLRRRNFLVPFFLGSRRIPFLRSGSRILTEAGRHQSEEFVVTEYLAECLESMTPETLYAWLTRLYSSFHWQGSTATTQSISLELRGQSVRMPFMDRRLLEFCSAMPEHWGRGLDFNNTKYPLKWMLANKIDYPMHLQVGPHSYLYDVDPTFNHYAEITYASATTAYFKDILKPKTYHEVLSGEFFDLPYLDSLVDGYLGGKEARGQELNDLCALYMFCTTGWY